MNYLKDPAAIYAKSFAIIREEANLSAVPEDAQNIAVRIIHSCGMPEIVADLVISDNFATAAAKAAIEAAGGSLV